jgi:peptide/nickel transport system substrate-binding protein
MMRLTRRAALAGATALPALPALHRAARAATTPGVLRFGLSAYPPTLAPWANAGTAAGTAQALMNRGLTGYAPDGSLTGEMAESWTREGEATWTFRLREAVWHNGQPVTSEHIKWNFEQIAAEKSTAYMRVQCQEIARIDTPDARTVKLVMKAPNATVPLMLATYFMPMVFPDSVSASAPQGIGAGPFVLKAAERGVGLEFEANPHYYKPGLPKLKGIRATAYADENLRVAALQAGDLDLIEYVPWQSMAAIEADPRLVLQTTEGPYMYLTFNGRAGPLADKRVRQAVAHAIKRDEVVRAAFFGRGSPLEGVPMDKSGPFFDAARSRGQAYDPARAKALLAEAGLADGFTTSLLSTATYGMHKDTAEIIQQNLAAIGIQAELRLPDWSTRVALGNRGQYEIGLMGTAAESNDPDGIANQVDGNLSNSYGRSINLPTPHIHELLARGRARFDAEARRAIYAEMEQAVLDEANFVGIAWRAQGYAFTRALTGFQNLPGALSFFSGLTLDRAALA